MVILSLEKPKISLWNAASLIARASTECPLISRDVRESVVLGPLSGADLVSAGRRYGTTAATFSG